MIHRVGVDMCTRSTLQGSCFHANIWLTPYWLASSNLKTHCQYQHHSHEGILWRLTVFFGKWKWWTDSCRELRNQHSNYIKKKALHWNFTLKKEKLMWGCLRDEKKFHPQQLGGTPERAGAAGSGYNWAEIGLPWQRDFVQSIALYWLDVMLSLTRSLGKNTISAVAYHQIFDRSLNSCLKDNEVLMLGVASNGCTSHLHIYELNSLIHCQLLCIWTYRIVSHLGYVTATFMIEGQIQQYKCWYQCSFCDLRAFSQSYSSWLLAKVANN